MQIRELLLPFIFLGASLAHAAPAEVPAAAAVVDWIDSNSPAAVSRKQAERIVRDTYRISAQRDLDPVLVIAMIRTESHFRANAVSSAGARGLLQVLPRYHQDKLGKRNPSNPTVSIDVGTQILKDCKDKHSGNFQKAMRCYSGGAGPKYAKAILERRAAILKFARTHAYERVLHSVVYHPQRARR